MDKYGESLIKSAFAVGATTLQFLFGGWSMPLQVLVAVITIDYLTGLGAAYVGKRLDSRIGARGIVKKVGYFALVALAHLLDQGTGMSAPVLQTATIWFLIANEGISITENLGEIGVPIPKVLLDALERLKKGDKEVEVEVK
jgi:toxin secretion/phage lysis holin